MDLKTRKYNFIQELLNIERSSILDVLERVLKSENQKENPISEELKRELENRIENYKKNPNDVLDWEDVKSDW
jgi:putative addiction module component (TIGR02574 family)